MSLRHALLTLLLERPSSGLELTRRFDRSFRYFWSASHQQVYRDLARLESDGFIRALPHEQGSRGSKKSYEVLPEGRAELASWVSSIEDPRPSREPILVRVRAASMVGTGNLADQLRRHRDLRQATYDDYLAVEQRDFGGDELDDIDRLRHVVLRGGIGLERFWIDFLDEVIAEVENIDANGTAARDGDESTG